MATIKKSQRNPRRIVKIALLGAFLVLLVVIFQGKQFQNFADLLYPPVPQEFMPYIDKAVEKCRVPVSRRGLIAALIWKESTFHPTSVSGAGAVGLTQVLRATAKGVADIEQIGGLDAQTIFNPDLNIMLGTCYLSQKVDDLGGWDNARAVEGALIAYNAGPARGASFVAGRYNGPVSSLGYARRILEAESVYTKQFQTYDLTKFNAQQNAPTTVLENVRQSLWKILLNQTP